MLSARSTILIREIKIQYAYREYHRSIEEGNRLKGVEESDSYYIQVDLSFGQNTGCFRTFSQLS
jgi:hypothetical protein